MTLYVRAYVPADADAWDLFCRDAHQATFLHSRNFLSYHGDRFKDLSLLIEADGRLVGVFPAAQSPDDPSCVVSHPGITYGGTIHHGFLSGDRSVAALREVCRFYEANGYRRLIYKAVPWFYHAVPAQDDVYALFRMGSIRYRVDLSSAIDLFNRMPVSERRKRGLKKAVRYGVQIREGGEYLPDFWGVLSDNLKRKHGISPVHTLDEINLLSSRFPENIRCVVGLVGGNVVAGVLIFMTSSVHHAQYIASSESGYSMSALDAIFEHSISAAKSRGARWFDFGISTERGGAVLNEGLYKFKSEFGGGGVVHEFYEIELTGRRDGD